MVGTHPVDFVDEPVCGTCGSNVGFDIRCLAYMKNKEDLLHMFVEKEMSSFSKIKWIEVQYLPFAFWTCQGVGINFRIAWWRMAIIVGIPDWFARIIFR